MRGRAICAFLVATALLAVPAMSLAGEKNWTGKDSYRKTAYKKAWGVKDRFFKKAYFCLKEKDRLQLNEQQQKKIKDLKISLKKELIRNRADIDVLNMDIKSATWSDPVDTKALGGLYEKKYNLKKQKMKKVIQAYSELDKVLNKKQKEMLKELKALYKREAGKGKTDQKD